MRGNAIFIAWSFNDRGRKTYTQKISCELQKKRFNSIGFFCHNQIKFLALFKWLSAGQFQCWSAKCQLIVLEKIVFNSHRYIFHWLLILFAAALFAFVFSFSLFLLLLLCIHSFSLLHFITKSRTCTLHIFGFSSDLGKFDYRGQLQYTKHIKHNFWTLGSYVCHASLLVHQSNGIE